MYSQTTGSATNAVDFIITANNQGVRSYEAAWPYDKGSLGRQ